MCTAQRSAHTIMHVQALCVHLGRVLYLIYELIFPSFFFFWLSDPLFLSAPPEFYRKYYGFLKFVITEVSILWYVFCSYYYNYAQALICR